MGTGLLNDIENLTSVSLSVHMANTAVNHVQIWLHVRAAKIIASEIFQSPPHIYAITPDLSSDKKVTHKTLQGLALSDSNNPAGGQIMIYLLWLESTWGSIVYICGSWASHCSIGATQREYIWCKIASSVYNSIWSL